MLCGKNSSFISKLHWARRSSYVCTPFTVEYDGHMERFQGFNHRGIRYWESHARLLFWLPRNLSNHMDRQARTRDKVLVKSREITGRSPHCTFSNILQKVNSNLLPISIILRLIPIEIPKKYKIEAPYWTVTLSFIKSYLIFNLFLRARMCWQLFCL